MADDTQAVVETTEAPAKPTTEVTSARDDDLDSLLNQYDQAVKPPEPKPAPTTTPVAHDTLPPDIADIRRFIFDQDMNKTVAKVRGGLDPEFYDDALLRGWINEQAIADPRLGQAWLNRMANPKQFDKVVETLGRNFAKKYGKTPDRQATDDRDAVTAAVRGASTSAPEEKAPDFGSMSDNDFAAERKKRYGY